jgi:hypothetical protein
LGAFWGILINGEFFGFWDFSKFYIFFQISKNI